MGAGRGEWPARPAAAGVGFVEGRGCKVTQRCPTLAQRAAGRIVPLTRAADWFMGSGKGCPTAVVLQHKSTRLYNRNGLSDWRTMVQ